MKTGYNKENNTFTTDGGQVLKYLHKETEECKKYGCVIHSPSKHHMKDWPLIWREDRNIPERICSHSCGHPDPDYLNYVKRKFGTKQMELESIHGCCSCCIPPESK